MTTNNNGRTVATSPRNALGVEAALIEGNLALLTPEQRVELYHHRCESLHLNKWTQPFQYITLNGNLTLYTTKNATDQLRSLHKVSIVGLERETIGDLCVVTATARLPDGREDTEIGAINIKGLGGEALANAMMKAGTKAKRRVTLSICGLGMLDESELDGIPNGRVVRVDQETGEILSFASEPAALPAPHATDEARRRGRFFGRAKELGYASHSAIHAAMGLPPTEGALATYVRDALGGDWGAALDHLEEVGPAKAAAPANVDRETGEIVDPPTEPALCQVCGKYPQEGATPTGLMACQECIDAAEREALEQAATPMPAGAAIPREDGRRFVNVTELLKAAGAELGMKPTPEHPISEQISQLIGTTEWKGCKPDELGSYWAQLVAARAA